jgi:endo-1,4-beta-xylanase
MTRHSLPAALVPLLLVCGLPVCLEAAAIADGKPKWLGSAYSSGQSPNFATYFNQITPENGGKWGSVEGTRDVMNWGEVDAAYNLAKTNGWPFRFHILVWGNQQPAWIAGLPVDEKLEEIQEWFAAVAVRYPDIDYLEVVNEPISDPPDGLPGMFEAPGDLNDGNYIDALGGAGDTGWDWVLNAFRLARPLFPNAKLVLNEYSLLNDGNKLAQYVDLIELLQAENLVDVVSEQAHSFTVAAPSAATLQNNLDALAATGLPIMITEMDIDGSDSTTANDQLQLERYQRVFPILWDHPSVIGVTLWGWRPGLWRANAVLVLGNGTERSAFTWMKDYVAASDPPLLATVTEAPVDAIVRAGTAAAFTVAANGNPAPAIQWQRSTDDGATWNNVSDDATLSGSTTATLAINNAAQGMDGDQFRAVITNGHNGSPASAAATLTVVTIDNTTPGPVTTPAGGSTTLTVAVTSGAGTPAVQWQHQEAGGTWSDVPGGTGLSYIIRSMQSFLAGNYRAAVTVAGETVYGPAITVNHTAAGPSSARLLNLSTRGLSLTGDQVLIPGFVIGGTGTKRLLIRAVGPTLATPDYNVSGTLPDPRMILRRLDFSLTPPAYVDVDSNDDWVDAPNAGDITQAIADLSAFEFQSDAEAALLLDLAPGQYTVVADGVGGATGVAIVELYDADNASSGTRLANISNRGFAGVGDEVMIPGFVISSEGPKTVLVRVVGPSLTPPPYNVVGAMADPKLSVFSGPTEILTNDNWEDNPDAANTATVAGAVGAFALQAGSADAAFVITLQPGLYTVVGSAANGVDTGVILVEVYVVQ